jgi:hypothetical protein
LSTSMLRQSNCRHLFKTYSNLKYVVYYLTLRGHLTPVGALNPCRQYVASATWFSTTWMSSSERT